MAGSGNHFKSDLYGKRWHPEFSEVSKLRKDDFYVDGKRPLDTAGDVLFLFLRDEGEVIPSSLVDDVEEYCQGASSDTGVPGATVTSQRRAAWLDDRASSAENNDCRSFRRYPNRLTALELQHALELPRFDSRDPSLPDADRRLIYIENLDPQYILALVETALVHQRGTLRDVIGDHIACQTSIRIKTLPAGDYHIFELAFHLPHYALRTHSSLEDALPDFVHTGAAGKPIDISFLRMQTQKTNEGKNQYQLLKTRNSVAICGIDDSTWVAYAFVDRDTSVDDDEEEIIIPLEAFNEDPILSNGGDVMDANEPIREPRQYFLKALENHVRKVLVEWRYLVRYLERSVAQFHVEHFSDPSNPLKSIKERNKDVPATIGRLKELLAELVKVSSESIDAWAQFEARNGDVAYLTDLENLPPHEKLQVSLSLCAIQANFQDLQRQRNKLMTLKADLKESSNAWAETVQLQLAIEGNETARHAVQVLSPFLLTVAYFSMNRDAVPFKVNVVTFVLFLTFTALFVRLAFLGPGTLSVLTRSWKEGFPRIKDVQIHIMQTRSMTIRCWISRRVPSWLEKLYANHQEWRDEKTKVPGAGATWNYARVAEEESGLPFIGKAEGPSNQETHTQRSSWIWMPKWPSNFASQVRLSSKSAASRFSLTCLWVQRQSGLFDPLVPANHVRLRTTCNCGETFHYDIPEALIKEALETTQALRASGYDTTVYHNPYATPLEVPPISETMSNDISSTEQDDDGVPNTGHRFMELGTESDDPPVVLTEQGTESMSLMPYNQWLLFCLRTRGDDHKVVHIPLQPLQSDSAVLRLLKNEYSRSRGPLKRLLGYKRVKAMSFKQFYLVPSEGSRADVALINSEWGPPPGWNEGHYWEPCPNNEKPHRLKIAETFLLHRWHDSHDNSTVMKFITLRQKLKKAARWLLSKLLCCCIDPGAPGVDSLAEQGIQLGLGGAGAASGVQDNLPAAATGSAPYSSENDDPRGIFNLAPKRLQERMRGDNHHPPLGWGVALEEGYTVPPAFQVLGFFLLSTFLLAAFTKSVMQLWISGLKDFGAWQALLGSISAFLASILLYIKLA